MLQQTVPRIESLSVKELSCIAGCEIARYYAVVCLFGTKR